MKFDLFDTMSVMKKNFGSDGEVLLTQNSTGISVRLVVYAKGEFHNNEFAISSTEMMTDTYVNICNFKFSRAITQLERLIVDYENKS